MSDANRGKDGQTEPSVYPMRLQKFLARAGVGGRRRSEDLMTAGRVTVNGEVVTKLGSKVDPLADAVEVDGILVEWGSDPVYLMLNKPAGYVTTMNDPQGRPCMSDLVPAGDYPGLYHVGRLDRMTRGLLLFTTDGDAGHGLLHPSHHVSKTYIATVEGVPGRRALAALRNGIMLSDGMTAPATAELVDRQGNVGVIKLVIHEGRTRQVRRMCTAVGHECIDLQRVTFGPLSLGDLEEGQWRLLDDREANAIRSAIGKTC